VNPSPLLPRPTISAFDHWLHERILRLDTVVVGGSALVLLGVTDRQARDVDVLVPDLADDVREAARSFAASVRSQGSELADEWLNNGPAQPAEILPEGWQSRVRSIYAGRALTLRTLGRGDLLKTKLFALCDRGTDLADCIALAPNAAELSEARVWLFEQDAHNLWGEHVTSTLTNLGTRLGHGI
jgi:hypothetical protein